MHDDEDLVSEIRDFSDPDAEPAQGPQHVG
jgi:hypothetical protein